MRKARILIVEDEGIIADDLQARLEEGGYEVTAVVATGEEAIAQTKADPPDLVLMDIYLQGEIDGIEATNAIASHLQVPTIYLTAHADDATLERAKLTAPSGYVLKPFRDRDLYSTIETSLFRHQLEKALKDREEWLSTLLQSMGDAVIATDSDGRVNLMNVLACRLTGWDESAATGLPVSEVFTVIEADSPELAAYLRQVSAGTFPDEALPAQDAVLIDKDGEEMVVQTVATPIKDPKDTTIGSVVAFRDVTEQREATEQLQLLSEVVHQCSEGIAALDVDGNLLFVNQAFAEMHSYSPERLAGQHLSVFHTPDQMKSVEKANKDLKKHGHFSGEIWHRRSDGSVFPGLMQNSMLHDSYGNVIGHIRTLRDITDIKEAEREVLRSHEKLEAYSSTLENMVRDRTRDLEDSRKELQKYSESLEKTNEALKIIIQGIEEQKKDVEKKVAHNLNLTVSPIIDQLKTLDVPDTVRFLLQSLEFNLTNLFSSFGANLAKDGQALTPKEIRICEMIRSGLSSKQMAKVLAISPQTVLVHRKNIRKKLGLSKSRKNLASYLKVNL